MEFLNTGFLSFATALLFLAGLIFLCGRIGVPLFNFLEKEEKALFSVAFGIVVLSLGVLVLGLLGLLTLRSATILLCALFLLTFVFKNKKASTVLTLKNFAKLDPALCFVLLLSGAVLFLAFLQCGEPATGNDALAYHLAYPREFILNHRIGHLPMTRESLWPFQTEMLFTLGLLLQGTTLAQMWHWFFYPATTLAIYSFGRRFFDAPTGLASALVFLWTPAVFAQSSEAYVDLSLTFFIFLSVYAWMLCGTIGESRASFFSGIFCGAALATKYLALGPAFLLFVWVCLDSKKRFKNAVLFAAAAIAVSGIWYLRSWLVLGNPVYPFLPHLFGGKGFDFGLSDGVGMGEGLFDFLLLPWNISVHPEAFGGERLGPVFLLFAPFSVLFIRKAEKKHLILAGFVLGCALFIFKQAQQARFFIAVLPFLSLAAGSSIRFLLQKKAWTRIPVFFVLGTLLISYTGLFIYRSRETWGVLAGKQSAEEYLLRHERSFRGYRYLEEHTEKGSRIFNSATVRRFYNPGLDILYDEFAFRETLAKRGLSLAEYLDQGSFESIWLSDDSEPEVREYVREKNYKKVFSYSFPEKTHNYHYEFYKRA